jgi:hypothetical protein
MLFLSQIKQGGVVCREVLSNGSTAHLVLHASSVYELAKEAVKNGVPLKSIIEKHGLGESVNLAELAKNNQVDCPVRHPDPEQD